jgi:hypothetical protein
MHKFRHGHAVYVLKNAKDIPVLKAVSQNLMYSNLSITDGVYGILSDMDVRSEIHNLGKGQKDEDILRMVRKLLQQKGFWSGVRRKGWKYLRARQVSDPLKA